MLAEEISSRNPSKRLELVLDGATDGTVEPEIAVCKVLLRDVVGASSVDSYASLKRSATLEVVEVLDGLDVVEVVVTFFAGKIVLILAAPAS